MLKTEKELEKDGERVRRWICTKFLKIFCSANIAPLFQTTFEIKHER